MKIEALKIFFLFLLLAYSGNTFFTSLNTPTNYVKLAAATIGFLLFLILSFTAIKRFLKNQKILK